MSQTLRDNFERCCRLCAEEQDVTIMIFSQEAEAMLLRNKLNRYLLIEVDKDDKLPKNICIQCCTNLQTVCNFIDTARKAQDVLLQRSFEVDQMMTNKCMISLVKTEVTKSDQHSGTEKNAEMEVNVDPMMDLPNSEGNLSFTFDHGSFVEDVTYLHGLDTENVTIKLIKKSDKQPESEDDAKSPPKSPISDDNEYDDKSTPVMKPYQCSSCERSFWSELALKNHTWIHISEDKEEQAFTCNTCSDSFNYKHELIEHLKRHRNNGVCQICGRNFRSERTYVSHMSVHLPTSKSYTCKICGRSYNTWGGLKTHSVTHSSDRPYQCEFCMKAFKRSQDLKFHTNQHTGAKPYKCPFCDRCFASSGNRYSHRSRMHPGQQLGPNSGWVAKYETPMAGEPSNVPDEVPSYLTNVNGVLKYQCHLCDHSFVKKENFSYHMYQHTGEKPFKCMFCSDKFVTRRGLLIHHDNKHPGKDRPLGVISKNAST